MVWSFQPQGLAHHLWPLCAPSASKWCGHFNHKPWFTICGPFVPHQGVSGVVISTSRPGSPFVASLCPWYYHLNYLFSLITIVPLASEHKHFLCSQNTHTYFLFLILSECRFCFTFIDASFLNMIVLLQEVRCFKFKLFHHLKDLFASHLHSWYVSTVAILL